MKDRVKKYEGVFSLGVFKDINEVSDLDIVVNNHKVCIKQNRTETIEIKEESSLVRSTTKEIKTNTFVLPENIDDSSLSFVLQGEELLAYFLLK